MTASTDKIETTAHTPLTPAPKRAPAGVSVGHVHLRVADLDRAIGFYRDVLGFDVQARFESGAAFLGAGGYHHHIALNTWGSAGGTPPPAGHTGLFHVAFRYPSRKALAEAVDRVLGAGITLTGKADHGVSEAVYLDDPDGNGIELSWDRPEGAWPRDAEGRIRMVNEPLDLDALLAAQG